MRFRFVLFPVLAVFLLQAGSHAKVWRILGGSEHRLNVTGLPWEGAYQTTMNVNGRRNEVHLYSARYTEPVVEQVRRQFEAQGARVTLRTTEEGASGIAKWEGREAKILVLSPKTEPRHLIFLFYPDPSARREQVVFPVPRYKQAEPKNVVVDEDTGVFSATIKTYDSATEVHDYYLAKLTSKGWSLVLPARISNGEVNGMAIYQKKKQICYVQAVNKQGRANIVTLLVKGGKL